MKYILEIVCITTWLITAESAKSMGPIGNVVINSIYGCEEKSVGDDIVITAEIKNLDDKGNKAMFATLKNKIPIDATVNHNIDVYKMENGNWKKFYTVKGIFCADVQKLLAKMWQKLRSAAKPPLTLPCPIPPGTYTIENFQASSKDLTLPSIFYGQFQLQLSWIKNGKMLACVRGEGDSQAP